MKKLTNVKCTATGNKITICADIVEADAGEFRFPAQRTTVGYLHEANPNWPRHVQVSNEAIFVKSAQNGLAITLDDFVSIATCAEPKTASPPVLVKVQDLTAEISSELNPDFQWQVSDNPRPIADKPSTPPPQPVWTDIKGATVKTLDKAMVKSGQWVRCIISSESGSLTSNPIKIV